MLDKSKNRTIDASIVIFFELTLLLVTLNNLKLLS